MFILAIDGPAGSGKSTVARRVAERLGFELVDTGAFYRAAALVALEQGLTEPSALVLALERARLTVHRGRVFLGERDVSAEIRTPAVSARSSEVSAWPEVRAWLLGPQRAAAMAVPRGAVLEGRDIGTVVFPDADLKVFLSASAAERARRRHLELEARGVESSYEVVLAEIERRDERDASRAIAPLRPASDAVRVDSSGRSVDAVVAEIVGLAEAKGQGA